VIFISVISIILSTKRNGGRWGINDKISFVVSKMIYLYVLKKLEN